MVILDNSGASSTLLGLKARLGSMSKYRIEIVQENIQNSQNQESDQKLFLYHFSILWGHHLSKNVYIAFSQNVNGNPSSPKNAKEAISVLVDDSLLLWPENRSKESSTSTEIASLGVLVLYRNLLIYRQHIYL